MSNFACIGLAGDEERVGPLLDRIVDEARPGPAASRYWNDASGACIAIHGGKRRVDCMTPFFASPRPTMWSVRSTAPAPDGECRHCSGVDIDILGDDGELVTRACVQLVEFAPYEAWLREERQWSLEVVAFAGALAAFPDEASFAADGEREGLPLAPNAFMPMGLFGTGDDATDIGQRAIALLAGTVVESARRPNTLSGDDFLHLVVDTLPGRLDVVAPTDLLDGIPTVGQIAKVQAWLVGRPTTPPPAPRRKFLGLF